MGIPRAIDCSISWQSAFCTSRAVTPKDAGPRGTVPLSNPTRPDLGPLVPNWSGARAIPMDDMDLMLRPQLQRVDGNPENPRPA